jgi:hypothetical protein
MTPDNRRSRGSAPKGALAEVDTPVGFHPTQATPEHTGKSALTATGVDTLIARCGQGDKAAAARHVLSPDNPHSGPEASAGHPAPLRTLEEHINAKCQRAAGRAISAVLRAQKAR